MSNSRGRGSVGGSGQKPYPPSGGAGGGSAGGGGSGGNAGSGGRLGRGGGRNSYGGPGVGASGTRWGSISGPGGSGGSPGPNSQHASPLPNHRGGGGGGAGRANSQGGAHHQQSNSAFPYLGAASANGTNDVMRDRMLFLLVSLVGFPVVASTKSRKFVGILSSASTDTGELGIVLSAAQELLAADGSNGDADGQQPEPGPLKKTLIIHGKDLDEVVAAEVKLGDAEAEIRGAKERQGFRTDTEISAMDMFGPGSERTLQKWADDPTLLPIGQSFSRNDTRGGGLEDEGSVEPWDQFKANEAKFSLKSDYEETIYTTKLDKSGADFKEREKIAAQKAKEIMGTASSNPHVAEERGQIDHSRKDEEEAYGSVVRTPGKYVPPGARRPGEAASSATTANGSEVKTATAKSPQETPPVIKTTEPPADPAIVAIPKMDSKSPEYMMAMRKFAHSEKEKLDAHRTAMNKKDKESKFADFRKWHSEFSLKTPVPADVASLSPRNLGKPRDPNLQKSLSPTAAQMAAATQPLESATAAKKASEAPSERAVSGATTAVPSSRARIAGPPKSSSAAHLAEAKANFASMTIPTIPPFDPERAKARRAALAAGADPKAVTPTTAAKLEEAKKSTASDAAASGKLSASSAAFKMSAKASSFKPFNPNATSFTPGASNTTPASISVPKVADTTNLDTTPAAIHVAGAAAAAVPANPFFGVKVPKKLAVSHVPFRIRDDFDPFKANAHLPDASTITTAWEFSGKPYRMHFVAHSIPFLAGPSGMPQPFEDGSSPGSFQPGMLMGAGIQHLPMHIPGPPPSGAPTPTLAPHIPGQPHPSGQQFIPFQPYGGQYFRGPPSQQGGPPTPAHQHLSIPGGPHIAGGPQQHLPHHSQQPSQSGAPSTGPTGTGGQQQQSQQLQPGSHPIPHLIPQMGLPVHPSMPYGNIPPQFMGGMPYAGTMPPPQGGPPGTMYSPQMANMAPPGPGRPQGGPQGAPPFIPSGPAGGNVMRPGPGGPGGPQHIHKVVPQHMYYQPGPMPMQYAPQFMNPAIRPQMMDNSGGGIPSFGSPAPSAAGSAGQQPSQQQSQQQQQGQNGGPANGAAEAH